MADREIRTEQQVKDKIKAFNKQRAGLSTAFIIFIGLLMFLPAAGAEALPVRLSVFCSAIFLLCGAAFVLSFRDLLIPVILLVLWAMWHSWDTLWSALSMLFQ